MDIRLRDNFRKYLFGENTPSTSFLNAVAEIFMEVVREGDTPQEMCTNFVNRIATHTFRVPCIDLDMQRFIVDCLCGVGAFYYLTQNTNNVVNDFYVEGFVAEAVDVDESFVKSTIGLYTGCTNKNVYATVYKLFEETLSSVTGTMDTDERMKRLLHNNSVNTNVRIIHLLTCIYNEGMTFAKERDDIVAMFSKVVLDDVELRLQYVCKGVDKEVSDKYKALVIKHLDLIEKAEMEERAKKEG